MDERTQDSPGSPLLEAAAGLAAQEEATLWQARAAYLQTQAQRAAEANAALHEKALTLQSQLCALQAHAAGLQTRLAQTQAHLDRAQMAATAAPQLAGAAPQPPIVDLVAQLPRSLDPANQYAQRPLAQIRHLVLHHSGAAGAALTPLQMAEFHVNDLKHQWPGIGFHFFIAADGVIYQTNRLETVCFHVVNNNATAAGVVLAGQFDGGSPAAGQMASAASLLAWLLQELRLPIECIVGHSEFADQETTCPGTDWQGYSRWKDTLLDHVRLRSQATRRPIYHYVLFWQTETGWAEADWQAAAHYLARFRPTAGFAAQEASQAENVTIIGGPSGVSPQIEDMLRSAGCRVQRIAGRNVKETRALLDALARDGQRFLTT